MFMVCYTESFPVIAQVPETIISGNVNIHALTHAVTLPNNQSKSYRLKSTNGCNC